VVHFFWRIFSKSGFRQFIRWVNDISAGVPVIICGVFVYGAIVATGVFFGQSYTGCRQGASGPLAILWLPTVDQNHDEGSQLVPSRSAMGAIGVGASKFVRFTRNHLPSASHRLPPCGGW